MWWSVVEGGVLGGAPGEGLGHAVGVGGDFGEGGGGRLRRRRWSEHGAGRTIGQRRDAGLGDKIGLVEEKEVTKMRDFGVV